MFAASLNSPETGRLLVVGVATLVAVGGGLRFWLAWRRNLRLAAALGGMTPTERSIGRLHAVAILGALIGSMALAVASQFSTSVRSMLASVGEHSAVLTKAAVPAVALYGLWLRWALRRAGQERARRSQP